MLYLASAGDEEPSLSSQEVAALAECTVLSHLRDLLNSNVSWLRQKPGLQYCLNLHSELGRVFRTAISLFWTVHAVSKIVSSYLWTESSIFIFLDLTYLKDVY